MCGVSFTHEQAVRSVGQGGDRHRRQSRDRARDRDWAAAGRLGEPEDMAGAAIFLASPASDFVTGTFISADGGRKAGDKAWPRPQTRRVTVHGQRRGVASR